MPELPCFPLLGEDGWKLLHNMANKTTKKSNNPYTIKGAAETLLPKIILDDWDSRTGGASDGPLGVKTIWIGLMKLYILAAYRECLA
jgi:hypothetical protein